MIKYFSMFSGIGGFELGLQNSKHDFKCVGFSEIDPYAVSIYEKNFPNHINYGDATKIRTEELPDFDFLVGGFPCQAFSVAGKRRGFDDTRGTLFFEIARVLKDKRPKYFLLENVRGLLSHEKGKTFQTILKVLSDLGYVVQWTLLNSADFKVPQRRERVFVEGYIREECRGKVLSVKRNYGKDFNELKEIHNDTGDTPKYFSRIDKNRLMTTTKDGDALCVTTTRPTRPITKQLTNYVLENYFVPLDEQRAVTTDKEQKNAYAITTRQRGTPLSKRQDNYVLECIGSTQKHAARTDGTYSPTLTCAMGNGGGHVPMLKLHDYRIRKLTPRECERLQGFPDDWTKYSKDGKLISDTQRYKCCGNAVTTTVITAIVDEMFDHEM